MRYVYIAVGVVAIALGLTVWRYDGLLLLAGLAALLTGVFRKEMHRPNWSSQSSLRD